MLRDHGFIEMYAGGLDVRKTVTADATGTYTYTLKPYEQQVVVDSTLGNSTLRLPRVSEAMGRMYSIRILAANDVVIAEYSTNESLDFTAPGTLSDADDRVLLYSDGLMWWTLVDKSS
jgi:hypothetical protein